MNEVEIVVKTNDKTDFNAIAAKARAGMTKSVKSSLDDVEKQTNARFREIGEHSGESLNSALDEHLRRWGDHATETIDVKVKTKFKEVGEHSGSMFSSGLENKLGGEISNIGSQVGTKLGASVGQSGAEAGASAGPYVMAALGAAMLALAPSIGALAATAIVLAFGAGLAGLGLMAAFRLKSVQKEFGKFQKFLGSFTKDIGKPFEGVWDQIFKTGTSVLKAFQPVLKSAFKGMAPALEGFVRNFGSAFKQLIPAIAPLSRAFSSLLSAIGPQLPGIFHGIAQAITEMSNVIASNPKLFAGFITGLVGLVPAGLKAVAFLAKLFAAFARFLHTDNPFKVMLASLSPMLALLMHLGKAGEVLHTLGDAAKSLGGHLSGVFDKVKAVAGPRLKEIEGQVKNELVPAFERFVKAISPIAGKLVDLFGPTVVSNVRTFLDLTSGVIDVISGILDAVSGLASGDWSRVWDGLKEGARGAVKIVKAAVRSILDSLTLGHGGKVISITVKAIDKASHVISGVIGWVRRIVGKTVHIGQTGGSAVISIVSRAISTIRRFVGKVVHIGESGASAAINMVSRLIGIIRRLVGKVVRVGANVFGLGGVYNLIGAISRVASKTVNIVAHAFGFEHGGIVGHAAEGGPRSNTVMVGEHGPELVNLPAGSRVRSNSDTRAALAGGGGVQKLQIEWVGGQAGDEFFRWLKKNIRIRVGSGPNSVQKALGG